MQNIYNKIDTMFSGENDDKPQWAIDILSELKEIKDLLKESKSLVHPNQNIKTHNYDKYNFVNKLRAALKPNIELDIFPYIKFEGSYYGVNLKGLLYSKIDQNSTVSREKAFKIYDSLYKSNQNIYSLVHTN